MRSLNLEVVNIIEANLTAVGVNISHFSPLQMAALCLGIYIPKCLS